MFFYMKISYSLLHILIFINKDNIYRDGDGDDDQIKRVNFKKTFILSVTKTRGGGKILRITNTAHKSNTTMQKICFCVLDYVGISYTLRGQ